MRAVVQRVSRASVSIDGNKISEIGIGLLVLLCVENGDAEQDIDYVCKKLLSLRIFNDENGKMNLSIPQSAEILLVSQFTLSGDARRGNRPSFSNSARPEAAIPIYEEIASRLAKAVSVKRGVFGADMQVELINDGPVTILLDSKRLF